MVQKKFRKRKQTKTSLVFDEKARESFLTGFKKRKDERRKRGREQLEEQFKEEKRRLRQKEKDKMLSRIKSQIPFEEAEEVLESTTYELPNHTVSITEVLEVDLKNDDGTRLGNNKMEGDEDNDESDEDNEERKKIAFKEKNLPKSKKEKKHWPKSTSMKKGRKKPLLNPFDPAPHTKGRIKGGQRLSTTKKKPRRRRQQLPKS